MSFVKEFKDFAMKGNIVDLAVAVIIGAAFGAIITSLVEDIITPLILSPALKMAHAENIEQLSWNGVLYGKFLSAIIKFLMVAIALFAVIKAINSAKKNTVAAPAPPTATEALLAEIRDSLKK